MTLVDWLERMKGRPRPRRGRRARGAPAIQEPGLELDPTPVLPRPAPDPGRAPEVRPPPAPVPPLPPPVVAVYPRAEPRRAGGADPVTRTLYKSGGSEHDAVLGVLVGIGGKLIGELYRVGDGESTLGRDPRCEVRFPERDAHISRRHASIVHTSGLFAIKPLRDDNPTFVNGARIEGVTELPDRAEISLGGSELRFLAVHG